MRAAQITIHSMSFCLVLSNILTVHAHHHLMTSKEITALQPSINITSLHALVTCASMNKEKGLT